MPITTDLALAIYRFIEPGLQTAGQREAVADALTALASGDDDTQRAALAKLVYVYEDVSTEVPDATIP